MSDDLIKRSDAIGACAYETIECYEARKTIKNLPSAGRPQKVIAQITFDEEKLREIIKEAVERFKEEYEITDRPQGEWIVSDDKYFHTCQFCNADVDVSMGTGIFVNNDEVSHMNYCPNCGAKMKGADDE